MAADTPAQAPPPPATNVNVEKVQKEVAAASAAVKAQPPPSQTVRDLNTNSMNQGVMFRPGQTVDIPHKLGRVPTQVNPVRVVTNTNSANSAPAAVPNLQMVTVRNSAGKKMVRVRYIAPKDDTGANINTPVRLHVEVR